MYALAKETNMPYSTAFNIVKKLESLQLIKELQETEVEKSRRKIIYTLTNRGVACLQGLIGSFEVGTKEPVDIESNPLSNIMTKFLLSQKRETSEIDFKSTLDIRKDSDFANIAKDIFAMSNYGGGYLIIGFKETESGSFEPIGLPHTFHVEQATLQEKFNAYSNCPISIEYSEMTFASKKFGVIYIPSSCGILKPVKKGTYMDNGKLKTVFLTDEILFRRGTQSIRASEDEIKFIERRSKETEYKIGLISGMPDKVKENIYSNIFEAIKLPEVLYEAELPHNIRFASFETPNITYARQNDRIFSFCDISKEPMGHYLKKSSFQIHKVSDYRSQPDKRNILTWLLNQEIRSVALKLGLRFDRRKKNVFFFPLEPNTSEKHESWESRFKKSKRTVAKKIFIGSLRRSVFVHTAASISFSPIGSDYYLEITPQIVLTHDGYEAIQGVREGVVKTKLIYNQYNVSFLNLVLFWVSKFKKPNSNTISLNDRIIVSAEPITLTLNVGIRSDRPSNEFSRRKEELYSLFEEGNE